MQVNPDIKVIHHTIDASRLSHSARQACASCSCVCERQIECVFVSVGKCMMCVCAPQGSTANIAP